MKFTKDNIKTTNKAPGVYYIRNIVNDKYYVGQARSVRTRLYQHYGHATNKLNYPIYKAINKYGFENFEIGVIKDFPNTEWETVKEELDVLEIEYIKKFNSYGATGYNQTFGGDGGITGYKFTEEQRNKVSKISNEYNAARKPCFAYDTNTKQIIEAISQCKLQEAINGKKYTTGILKHIDTNKLYFNRYIIVSDKNMLTEDYINKIIYKNRKLLNNNCSRSTKYTLDEYYEKLKSFAVHYGWDLYSIPTNEEIASYLSLSKMTVCNYNKKLKELGKLISPSHLKRYLIIDKSNEQEK